MALGTTLSILVSLLVSAELGESPVDSSMGFLARYGRIRVMADRAAVIVSDAESIHCAGDSCVIEVYGRGARELAKLLNNPWIYSTSGTPRVISSYLIHSLQASTELTLVVLFEEESLFVLPQQRTIACDPDFFTLSGSSDFQRPYRPIVKEVAVRRWRGGQAIDASSADESMSTSVLPRSSDAESRSTDADGSLSIPAPVEHMQHGHDVAVSSESRGAITGQAVSDANGSNGFGVTVDLTGGQNPFQNDNALDALASLSTPGFENPEAMRVGAEIERRERLSLDVLKALSGDTSEMVPGD